MGQLAAGMPGGHSWCAPGTSHVANLYPKSCRPCGTHASSKGCRWREPRHAHRAHERKRRPTPVRPAACSPRQERRSLTISANTNTNSSSSRERCTTWLKLCRMVPIMRFSSGQQRASLKTRSRRAERSTDSELVSAGRCAWRWFGRTQQSAQQGLVWRLAPVNGGKQQRQAPAAGTSPAAAHSSRRPAAGTRRPPRGWPPR